MTSRLNVTSGEVGNRRWLAEYLANLMKVRIDYFFSKAAENIISGEIKMQDALTW